MTFIVKQKVQSEQIDYNQHMHDSEYNHVFSAAINEFNYSHGLSLDDREKLNYTTFTVEEHTTYLSELTLNESYEIHVNIYNFDEKRTHFFAQLFKKDGTLAATNEVMMMGISGNTRRPAPFPETYYTKIKHYYEEQGSIEWPKQLGHQIGIPRKGGLENE